MRLETTVDCPVETMEMAPALDRVMVAAGFGTNEEAEAGLSLDSIFSDLQSSLLAKRGRDVEEEDESDDEEDELDDEDDEEDELDDEEDEDEDEEEDDEDFEEEFDDDDLDDDDDIFYDDDEDE